LLLWSTKAFFIFGGAEHCVLKYERSTAELQTKEVQDAIGALDLLFGVWKMGAMDSHGTTFLPVSFKDIEGLHGWGSRYIHQGSSSSSFTAASCTLMTPIPTPYGWSNTLFLTYLVFAVVVLFESSDDDGPVMCDV